MSAATSLRRMQRQNPARIGAEPLDLILKGIVHRKQRVPVRPQQQFRGRLLPVGIRRRRIGGDEGFESFDRVDPVGGQKRDSTEREHEEHAAISAAPLDRAERLDRHRDVTRENSADEQADDDPDRLVSVGRAL